MPMLQCPVCHKTVEQGDRFCSACGAQLLAAASKAQELSKVRAEGSPSGQPSGQERPPRGNWHEYKNAWYGFTLEKPADWEVRTTDGVITICQDSEGYTSVAIRPLQLQQQASAETVACYLVGAMRKVVPSLTAWSVPSTQAELSNENALVMGVQATYGKVPLKGVFIVQVHDDVALMSGFQAPANKIEQTAPVMQRILSSLRFIERIPLQRYVESNEGAFSGYVPQGWHVRAMIRRTSDSASAPLNLLSCL